MKYLVDSNVFLEAALRRQHWQDAVAFLSGTPAIELAVGDFSLHAIGFYLIKKTPKIFDEIVSDVVGRNVAVLRIDPKDLTEVSATATRFRLDFDDAFVYTLAERNGLIIVSLDSDFDRTSRGRKTPGAAMLTP